MIVSTWRHISFSTLHWAHPWVPPWPEDNMSLCHPKIITYSIPITNYQLLIHWSLTLISNSLARDRVPVEAQRFLPSDQKHQEEDLRPPHTSYVSSHLALSDGLRDQSVDQSNSRERPSSWQRAWSKRKKKHISWRQQFTSFYWLSCLSETILSEQYLQHVHFSKRHTKEFTHSSRSER